MSQLEIAHNNAAADMERASSAYVPPLQRTEGQPPPIAANGGLSYMSFDRDGDAGTAAALEDALAEPFKMEDATMRGSVFERAHVALASVVALSALAPISGVAAEAPVNILFVGNSVTHGRYEPVRTYNAGFGADDVHDLLCPSLATCSSAEQGSQINPAETPPPGTTLSAQLAYLQANPSSQYNEPGPMAGYLEFFYNLHARRVSIIPSQSSR